jgi:hypothetical protein
LNLHPRANRTKRVGYGRRQLMWAAAPNRSHCTFSVMVLLVTPSKVALTVIVKPAELADRVPLPLPWVKVKSVGSELFQVTEEVMSCCVLLPGKIACAVKVTVVSWAGVVLGETERVMEVGVPSVTVIVVVAALTVPEAALMVVVQTPLTVLAGVTSPLELMVAHDVELELQFTFPVRSLVEPSL